MTKDTVDELVRKIDNYFASGCRDLDALRILIKEHLNETYLSCPYVTCPNKQLRDRPDTESTAGADGASQLSDEPYSRAIPHAIAPTISSTLTNSCPDSESDSVTNACPYADTGTIA